MKLFNRTGNNQNLNNNSNSQNINAGAVSAKPGFQGNPASKNTPQGNQQQNNNRRRQQFQRRNPNRPNQNRPQSNGTNGVGGRNNSGSNNRFRNNGNNRPFNRNNRGGSRHNGNNNVVDINKIYYTSSALNWGNTSSYQFSAEGATPLRIIPISGLEDVGTNCTVLEYGDDIMIIDAGLGFAGEELPGVDGLVPNLEYLYDKKDKIRGLVITHGHTDHIGGIHHILDSIGYPTIYAPRLAAGLIKEKLKETPHINRVKIIEYDGDSTYYLGKFHLSHFKMTHTIPDNFGIVIETPVGRVVTPSDFKFDLAPYKESPSDYSKLAKLGDEGILVLLHESTNARKKGWSAAETDIAKDLENVIRDSTGRVIIGMFSTMVNRIRQVVELADRHGKKVAILGRSLETVVRISHELGYINVLNSIFVPFDKINEIPDNKIVVLTTGSQGEPNAALMRMATDQHQKIKLKKSDLVVFSSSQIPGNEGKIENLINLITLHGCKILINDYLTIHASGHGNQDEHKLMLQLTKPKFLMPIHGDPSMLGALRDTAKGLGYTDQNVIMAKNGSVVEINQSGWQIKEQVNSTPLWVEGNRVGDFNPEIVEERRLLMDEGIVFVSIKNIAESSFGPGDIQIDHKGFFVQKKDEFLQKSLSRSITDLVSQSSDKRKELVESNVKRHVENELTREYQKKPMVVVSVM